MCTSSTCLIRANMERVRAWIRQKSVFCNPIPEVTSYYSCCTQFFRSESLGQAHIQEEGVTHRSGHQEGGVMRALPAASNHMQLSSSSAHPMHLLLAVLGCKSRFLGPCSFPKSLPWEEYWLSIEVEIVSWLCSHFLPTFSTFFSLGFVFGASAI